MNFKLTFGKPGEFFKEKYSCDTLIHSMIREYENLFYSITY